jgi:hypothetical protein
MKYKWAFCMFAGLMLLAAACKKEAEITNTADLGKPVFFFTGQAGSDGVSLAAGQNNITVTPTNVQEEALVPGTSTPDANLFKTGSWFGDIYGNNLPWFVSVLFAVPSADSLKVKTYLPAKWRLNSGAAQWPTTTVRTHT